MNRKKSLNRLLEYFENYEQKERKDKIDIEDFCYKHNIGLIEHDKYEVFIEECDRESFVKAIRESGVEYEYTQGIVYYLDNYYIGDWVTVYFEKGEKTREQIQDFEYWKELRYTSLRW